MSSLLILELHLLLFLEVLDSGDFLSVLGSIEIGSLLFLGLSCLFSSSLLDQD